VDGDSDGGGSRTLTGLFGPEGERLLAFVLMEVENQGGGTATVFSDRLASVNGITDVTRTSQIGRV